MKKQFVIATHGTFAEGLYHSLTIIMGEQPDFSLLCAYTTEVSIETQIKQLVDSFVEEDVIILTDVFGGSVNNYFMKYIEQKNIHLVTGVNLPLLLEIVCNKHLPVDEMIEKAIDAASHSFQYCKHLDFNIANEDF